MPNNDETDYSGHCPADVRAELDAALSAGGIGDGTDVFNKYKLTSTTLIGLIYHAEMYSAGPGPSNACADFNGSSLATAHSPSFTGGTSASDKFVIDYFSALYCVKANSYDGNTSYSAFGYVSDDTSPAIANLTTRYRHPYDGVSDPGQTDIFQVYVSLDPADATTQSPTSKFLAFNFAGVSSMYSRAIILSNLSTHKFAVRYTTGNLTLGNHHIIALGVGGVDKTTGTPVNGSYMIKIINTDGDNSSNLTSASYCVNNSAGTYDDANYTACTTTAAIPWDSISASNVATYLEMSTTEQTNLAGFLAYFNDTDLLSVDDFPRSEAEADSNFPRMIE